MCRNLVIITNLNVLIFRSWLWLTFIAYKNVKIEIKLIVCIFYEKKNQLNSIKLCNSEVKFGILVSML